MKIDLLKGYDKVSWVSIRMVLTPLGFGFEVPFINWVMNFLTFVSFVVLINISTSSFFHDKRGLR